MFASMIMAPFRGGDMVGQIAHERIEHPCGHFAAVRQTLFHRDLADHIHGVIEVADLP
jgi:hypothetical protein